MLKLAMVTPMITTNLESEKFYNVQVYNLGKALMEIENEMMIDIYTINRYKNEYLKILSLNDGRKIKVYYMNYIGLYKYPLIFNLLKKIKKEKYSVIHTAEIFQPTTLYLALQKKRLKIPIIAYHGRYFYPKKKPFDTLFKIYGYTVGGKIKKEIDYVVTKTTLAKKFLQNLGFQRIVTIPVGCNFNVFYPREKESSRKKLGIPLDKEILLFAGRFTISKNPLILLYVLKELLKDKYNVSLLLVGDGPLRNRIIEISEKMGIKNNVLLLGKIPNNEMPFVYSAADIFILPSIYEIFGMVLLESMGCGTPVISTPTPGAIDIIDNWKTGVLIPFNDPITLKESIIKLLDDPALRKRMGEEARKNVIHKYDWKGIAAKYLDVITQVVGGNER